MVEEAYCSFEVARLLKEKGFNEPTWTRYEDDNEVIFGNKYDWNKSPMGQTSAPTHQMAIAWILEKYNVSIEVSVLKHNCWCYTIYKILSNKVEELYNDGIFESHYKCTDKALKYSLENLI